MNSLLQVSLPGSILLTVLNAMVASLLACGVALLLCRRVSWSLPTRHALSVAAIAVSLATPLLVSVLRLPPLWTIEDGDRVTLPAPTVSSPPVVTTSGIDREAHAAANSPSDISPGSSQTIVTQLAEVPSTGVEPPDGSLDRVPEPADPAPVSPVLPAIMSAGTIGTLLCGIWVIGVAICLGRTIVTLRRLRQWTHTLVAAESETLVTTAHAVSIAAGLRCPAPVYCSALLPAPVTFGLLNPRIVVPKEIELELAPDQLRAVFQHEIAHIARRDLWVALMQQCAAIVYWWNPLVRLVNRRIADLREQICDDIAIRDLPDPGRFAETLIRLAERCSPRTAIPATLGIGASPTQQLESRILRILSPLGDRAVGLTRRSLVGVTVAVVLMATTLLMAQVQMKSPAGESPEAQHSAIPEKDPSQHNARDTNRATVAAAAESNPTLTELIRQIAKYEQQSLPFEIQSMETFRFPDDLSLEERARNLRADGRKHQRLMEYAQLAPRIWRTKETHLVDGEKQPGGPWQSFADGEQIVQSSPGSVVIDGKSSVDVFIQKKNAYLRNYPVATPLNGLFCLSTSGVGVLFSEHFQDENDVELTWDKGDAQLTFGYGKPHWNMRYVLWLSKDHAWHPVRLQRFWDANDKLFHDEWEVTKFVQEGDVWRVAKGEHRYRNRNPSDGTIDPQIKYTLEFEVLEQKYGKAVDPAQFRYEIPEGANVRDENKTAGETAAPTKTREITVTVVDVAQQPIPRATVRLAATPLRDWDKVSTDELGVAKSAKAPADNVALHISAEGFRPASWILGEGGNELRVILAPVWRGVVVDRGKPVSDAWVTNASLQFRADGLPYVPQPGWDGRDQDWSGADGQFAMKSSLTLRRFDTVLPLFTIDPKQKKMAIRFESADTTKEALELNLESTCLVRGECLLEGVSESADVAIAVESAKRQPIGFLTTRRQLVAGGQRVDFQLSLPPGEYVLTARKSSQHAGFEIPFSIPSGKSALDLGTTVVAPSEAVALKGKPAPELQLRWRPGEEKNWEQLRGKVVVLDFWGTWCVPCVNDMPLLMELADKFRDQPVEWLSVHTPELKTFEELDRALAVCQEKSWNRKPLPFTTVLDSPVPESKYSGQTSERFGVVEWPTLIVVDRKGVVVGPVSRKNLAGTISRLLEDRAGE